MGKTMPISDYNTSAALNLTLGSIPIGPGMAREKVNDALQQIMADIALFSDDALPGVSVTKYGAVADGVTNDSAAFDAAVAALPASGGEIYVPNAVGYLLNTTISTGTKKVTWRVGATTITCPIGAFGFKLQSNGCAFFGSGRGNTILKLRAPASPLVMPTVVTARTANVVTSATPSGGSGFVTVPIAIVANSPTVSDEAASDAAVIAKVSGGTVSALAVVAGGAAYVANPAVTFLGGGAGAIMIDEPQGCAVSNFSIDFQNIPNSVGVYHYGGWFADVTNIDRVYNVATGVSSEHTTSLGLVVDSHTNGAPGSTGSYGGVYVCRYSNLFFNKRALIGHDTSTGTTMQFSTCDFKASYIHGCVGITEINPVTQAPVSTDNYHLVNVDGLTMIGGDIEDAGTWFHVHGSCSNIRLFNVLTGSASGPRRRGPLGGGWLFDIANPASSIPPLRSGNSGTAGQRYQNTGWNQKHGNGIDYSGDVYVMGSSNITMLSASSGNLDDVTAGGFAITTTAGGAMRLYTASAGANPRALSQVGLWSGDQIEVGGGGLLVAGTKVLGTRGAAVADAVAAAAAPTQAEFNAFVTQFNALLARVRPAGHGLIT